MNTCNNPRIFQLIEKKSRAEKLSALTAYDYPSALIVDRAGVDIILVGDSLGNVVLGRDDTRGVTINEMIHHLSAVKRANPKALLVVDLPDHSYDSPELALESASMMMDAGAEAVKLEGGVAVEASIRKLTDSGIPVMGHAGLLPQTAHLDGGYRIKGKSDEEAQHIHEDAQAIESAGAFSIVLELVAPTVAEEITSSLKIPTIGIGAGDGCDGQILVFHDLLGLGPGPFPRHASPPVNYFDLMVETISSWDARIKSNGSGS